MPIRSVYTDQIMSSLAVVEACRKRSKHVFVPKTTIPSNWGVGHLLAQR